MGNETKLQLQLRMFVAAFLVVTLLIVLPFLAFGEFADRFILANLQIYSNDLLVIVLVILLLVSDVFAPIPSSSVSIAAGAGLGFPIGVTAVWVGMTGGSVLGYLIGRFGSEKLKIFTTRGSVFRDPRFAEGFGLVSIALCRPIPVLAEASAIMAGFVQLPFIRYVLVSASSNLIVAVVYTSLGVDAAMQGSIAWIVFASVAAPLPAWAIYLRIRRRQAPANERK